MAREIVGWLLKGAAMGAANVIPGVSGGTIAFITGIYERLINSLKSLDLHAFSLLISGKIRQLFAYIDFYFLSALVIGIALSILSLARILEWAFVNHEIFTLSFFFGLILASVYGVGKEIRHLFSPRVIITFLVGCGIAVSIAFLNPATANDGYFYVFLCGIVAVCSMILPGLSGSYILLLMGNYVLVLRAISSLDFGILLPLAVGCVVGLVVFSRLLSFLFSHYKNMTVSLLTGFVAGSLLIIWPWKTTEYVELTGGKIKAVGYNWFLPEIDSGFFVAFLLALIGFILVYGMEYFSKKNPSSK